MKKILIILAAIILTGCIELKTEPYADFYIEGDQIENQELIFINESNFADSYEWDFGDGTPIINSRTPKHTYNSQGHYTVTLKAINGKHESKISKIILIYKWKE